MSKNDLEVWWWRKVRLCHRKLAKFAVFLKTKKNLVFWNHLPVSLRLSKMNQMISRKINEKNQKIWTTSRIIKRYIVFIQLKKKYLEPYLIFYGFAVSDNYATVITYSSNWYEITKPLILQKKILHLRVKFSRSLSLPEKQTDMKLRNRSNNNRINSGRRPGLFQIPTFLKIKSLFVSQLVS